MALADITAFDQYTREAYTLVETQMSDKFNAASRGAIMMGADRQTSTIKKLSKWDRLSTVGRYRDPGADSAVTAVALKQFELQRVKVGRAWGPHTLDFSAADWNGVPFSQMGAARGAQIASDAMKQKLDDALLAFQGCSEVSSLSGLIENQSGTTADATKKMSLAFLNNAQARLGDNAPMTAAIVMHSKPYYDLIGANLANSAELFRYNDVLITNFLGKTIIVTDSVATTFTANSLTKYRTYILKPGAIRVYNGGEFRQESLPVIGRTNLNFTIQSQDSYSIEVMNMKRAVTSRVAGAADLTSSARWAVGPATVDLKDYGGVVLKTQ